MSNNIKKFIKLNNPVDWNNSFGLAESVRGIKIPVEDDGYIIGYPYLQTDPNGLNVKTLNPAATLSTPSRNLTQFKSNALVASTGNTALWTPAAGKKFRVLGMVMCLSKDAACAGQFIIEIRDEAGTTLFDITISNGALVAMGQPVMMYINFPGNGYLSAAPDNHLFVNLSGALTAGVLSASAWGTEE